MYLDTSINEIERPDLPTTITSLLQMEPSADASPPPFWAFPKIARLTRHVVCTEKLDGTNAQILITDDGDVFAGSRTRWIKPGKTTDNFGFAAWVEGHRQELLDLGPGKHFGEWWGHGIQSGYGLSDRRFSLFNVARWRSAVRTPDMPELIHIDPAAQYAPGCCDVVPVLYRGPFCTKVIDELIEDLRLDGSVAAPGFCEPEGLIVFHTAASVLFKRLLKNDETPKGLLH